MALLLHVHTPSQPPMAPFDLHLVRNLEWSRYDPSDEGEEGDDVDVVVLSPDSVLQGDELARRIRDGHRPLPVVVLHRLSETPVGMPSYGFEGVLWADRSTGGLSLVVSCSTGAGGTVHHHPSVASHGAYVVDPRQVPRGGGRTLLTERLGSRAGGIGASARAFMHGPSPQPLAHPPGPAGLAGLADQGSPPPVVTATGPRPLVHELLGLLDRVYGLRETADAVAGHLHDSVGADAVVVLVPDCAVWAVAGGIGHRHLEERFVLAEEHWVVRQVCAARHGIVVADTDMVRAELAGAPLAAWPHLMAAPLPDVDGIVLLARGQHGPPFTADDLAVTRRATNEAQGLFVAAVEVRDLARRLARFADLQHLGPSTSDDLPPGR